MGHVTNFYSAVPPNRTNPMVFLWNPIDKPLHELSGP